MCSSRVSHYSILVLIQQKITGTNSNATKAKNSKHT